MIVAIGLSHKTAPVAVREKVAFTVGLVPQMLKQAKNESKAQELVLLSTCNRTEFYGWMENPHNIVEWWQQQNAHIQTLSHHLYHYSEMGAVRHIMRVASGLDSMVVGEPQILSQLKQAYDIACDQKSIGNYLQRLFQKSFMVAKQVRTETAIGRNPVSIAYAAVKLSQKIFNDLKKVRVLLIGAGETIELVAQHLKAQGVTQETYVNRSYERAKALAHHMQGKAFRFEEMPERLSDFDIIISAVASAHPILHASCVHNALKKRKRHPIFMVDLGVPRNIDQDVGKHPDVFLYDLDDLQKVIQENLGNRQQEALLAESIIQQHACAFMGWMQAQNAIGVVKDYRQKVEHIKKLLVHKAYAELAAGQDPKKVIEYLAHRMAQKLLHTPSIKIKKAGEMNNEALVQTVSNFFTD